MGYVEKAGKTRSYHNVFGSDYAESTFLPFNLLLASTFLPFFVDIRFLKPCSLLLCLFLGWYVLNNSNTSSKFLKPFGNYLLFRFAANNHNRAK